nr:radical SAM protein [Sedimentibacter sp.]
MKVLLVRPKPHKDTIGLQHVMICEPLELEYLVSNVPEEINDNVEVKIIDLIIEKREYKDIVIKEEPSFILFTGYITHVGVIKSLAKEAKELLSNVIIGVGGVHAEVVPEDFKSEFIDFIYDKNGIDGFNLTLNELLNGKAVEDIKNKLSNIETKKTVFNYKYPDRDAVKQYRNQYYYMFHNPCALIKTSFGCPYNCSFCFCKEITDGKYFRRNIEDILGELQVIQEEEVYIVDDDFLYDANWLKEFAAGLKRNNIKKKFLVYGRADFITQNKEILIELKRCGLRAVIVGIESVRENDLKSYNKRTTKNINEECIKILKELNIELYATLIIPLDFTKENFRELTMWLRALDVRFVNLQPLTPLPGTEIFESYLDDLLVKREKYESWDMAHVVLKPEFMSIRRFYLGLLIVYYRVIMRPKHVFALIKKYGIRSNIKMFVGSSFVSFQYIQKIVRGH